jgi:hypothetical protein
MRGTRLLPGRSRAKLDHVSQPSVRPSLSGASRSQDLTSRTEREPVRANEPNRRREHRQRCVNHQPSR